MKQQYSRTLNNPRYNTKRVCPKCGRMLESKVGKFGRFWACIRWPNCDFAMSRTKTDKNKLRH